ncbi:hypothetical protein BDY19DRAFT_1020981, partial [Irpex rosettiformis]
MGRDGPVKLSWPAVVEEGETKILDTSRNDGFRKNLAPVCHPASCPTGFWLIPSSRDPKTSTRSYATTAFDQPNASRLNLTVLVIAVRRQVLLSTADSNGEMTVTGVEFEHEGKVHQIHVNKEVILSAGYVVITVHDTRTQHLLELSGIGRRNILDKAGIPLKVELPGSGENLQEHIYAGVSYELTDDAPLDTLDILRDPEVLAKQLELAKVGKELFHSGCVDIGFLALAQLSPERAPELHAKIEEIVQELESEVADAEKKGGAHPVKKGLVEQYKLLKQRYSDKAGEGSPGFQWISFPACSSTPNLPAPGKRYVTMMLVFNHGFSRGTLHAVSNDPSVPPEIDLRHLSQDV